LIPPSLIEFSPTVLKSFIVVKLQKSIQIEKITEENNRIVLI
jgi:hypothetical protein